MRALCWLFGHKATGYMRRKGWGGWDHGRIESRGHDGVARHHAAVYGECARCGAEFYLCAVHLPTTHPTKETPHE